MARAASFTKSETRPGKGRWGSVLDAFYVLRLMR